MLPKPHLVFGAIFSVILYITGFSVFSCVVILLSSILIDFDHYLYYIIKKKDFSLKRAYIWHERLDKFHKPMMMVFHTVEFLILVLILSYFNRIFIFIFIGMIFHSILDMLDMLKKGIFYAREYSLIRYLVSDKSKYL